MFLRIRGKRCNAETVDLVKKKKMTSRYAGSEKILRNVACMCTPSSKQSRVSDEGKVFEGEVPLNKGIRCTLCIHFHKRAPTYILIYVKLVQERKE